MWDEKYNNPEYVYGKVPCQFLNKHATWLEPGKQALAIADGEGRNSVFMAERGMVVTAMDSSSVGLKKASRLARERGIEIDYHLVDLKDWTWEAEYFDLVAAIFIQFADPGFRAQIFDGIKRTLKPGGVLLLHGYTPRQIEYGTGGPPVPELLYTRDMLMPHFKDWEIAELTEYDLDLQEGPGHSGLSALIDFIAIRPHEPTEP